MKNKKYQRHGLTETPEYKVWKTMKQRCLNTKSGGYPRYGGRGISVSAEWMLFINFYNDMGKRISPSHSLERLDNNKGYCKDNCVWELSFAQSRNKRNNVVLNFNGKSMNIADWAKEIGLKANIIGYRYRAKLPIDKILYKGKLPTHSKPNQKT